MAAPVNLAGISDADRRILEASIRAFELDWEVGLLESRVRGLGGPPWDGKLRLRALVEMIKVDMERQWQHGRRIALDSYVRSYPELAEPDGIDAGLVLAEEQVRRRFEVAADVEQDRWPTRAFADPPTEATGAAGKGGGTAEPPPTLPIGTEPTRIGDPASATGVIGDGDRTAGLSVGRAHGPITIPHRGSGEETRKAEVDTGKVLDNYELLEEIGRGGMGVVYKAREIDLNRIVALKMILSGEFASPAVIQRFRMEAETAALFEHPGIVPIFHIGMAQGQHYYTMGFVEGQSLSRRVAAGPLPPNEAAELTRQIAEAIQHAHAHDVVHRDLKPGNILIDAHGRPKVTDFGLAKVMQTDSGLTTTGQILGTPSYMAPEQAAGKAHEARAPADIYALGAILYCLLSGRPPFQAPTHTETLMRVLHDEPVALRRLQPSLDPDLETICLKCLAKDPARRYATAQELADDLRRFLDDEPISARPPSLMYRTRKFVHRRRHVVATLAAAVVLGVSLLLLSAEFSRRARARQVEGLLAEGRQQLERAARARSAESEPMFEAAMQSFAAAQALEPRSSRAGEELMVLYLRRCERALELGEYDAARALILPLRNLDRGGAHFERIVELERRALGTSRWRIDSIPAGCDVTVIRIDAGLEPEKPRRLGRTPLDEQDVPPGDYVLSLTHPDFAELRYPIRIGRGELRALMPALLRPSQIPQGMVYVPGGAFLFGDPHSGTIRPVELEGFFIDREEVNGADYERFIQETGTPPPDRWEGSRTCPAALRESPVHNVSWFDAYAYALWAGERLPTEVEWEKAARGVDGREFPWGNRFNPRNATSRQGLQHNGLSVGRHRGGASPYGCLDMAGNVWEWTLERERPGDSDRVLRGGAASSTPDELLTYRRKGAPPGGSNFGAPNLLGFRCVRALDPKKEVTPLLDALTTGPDLAEAADFFSEGGRWAEVRQCSRRLLELNPRSVPGNFWLAADLEREGKTAEALAALRLVFFQKFAYRSRSRSIADDLARVLTAEEKAGRNPDRTFLNAPQWFHHAWHDLDNNEYDKAKAHLQQVLKWDPENGAAHEQMATIAARRNDAATATLHHRKRIDGYRMAMRETPENAELIHEFAEFLSNNNLEPAEATSLARRAVEIDPYAPGYRKTLAELLARDSRWAEAIAQVREAIDLDPEDDALRDLLVSYKNNTQPAEAVR